MSKRTDDNIRLNFEVNGDGARKQINEIDKQAARLRTQMKGLAKDSKEYAATKNQLEQLTGEKKKLTKQIGLAGMTMRELNTEARRLKAIKSNLVPGTKQFNKVNGELAGVNNRLRELRTGSTQASVGLGAMAKNFSSYIGVVAGATASVTGLIMGGRRAIEVYASFEKEFAKLSAITGLVGDDLAYLEQQANEMATSVIDGNVKITQSAEDIVKAYAKVGSQRPELLKNKEALAEVTREAIILSEAAQIDLDSAVKAVTTTLNQFNISADETRRVINVIGAGSKEGAGDIPYLASALENVGTTANLMNMSLEQTVGAIETVAPFFTQAGQAGNSLDRVLLRMQKHGIGYVDGVFSMESALSELESRFAKGERAADIFGVEHAKMAEILVQNRQDFSRYTEAVTGSNVALEQAGINTDTHAAKVQQARNKVSNAMRDLGKAIAPIQANTTNFFATMLEGFTRLVTNWDRYREVVLAVMATLVAYNIQKLKTIGLKIKDIALTTQQSVAYALFAARIKTARAASLLYAAAQAGLAGNITKAAKAMQLFKVAMAGTPWGLIAAGITAVASAVYLYTRRKEEAIQAETVNQRMFAESERRYTKEAASVRILSSTIENNNLSLEQRRNAIERLKEIMPDYNGYLTSEGELIGHNTKQIEDYLKAVEKRIKQAVYEQELVKAHQKQMEARRAFDRMVDRYGDSEINVPEGEALDAFQLAVRITRQELEAANEALDSLTKEFSDFSVALQSDTGTGTQTGGPEKINGLYDEMQQHIQNVEKAIEQLTIRMRNSIFHENYEEAQMFNEELGKAHLLLQSLKGQDAVIRGIQAHDGNVDSFLGSFDDITDADRQAAEEASNIFWSMFETGQENRKSANEIYLEEQLAITSAITEEEVRKQQEAENKKKEMAMQRMEALRDFSRQLQYGLMDIFLNVEQGKTDSQLQELNKRREKALENENLTEEQKRSINDHYAKKEAQIKRQSFIRERNAKLIEAAINTAVAITKAAPDLVMMGIAAATGVIQAGVIRSKPVPQYAKGKYDVIGADDGKSYNAKWIGRPKTGLYSRPALFAETGSEIIIDPRTTRNIVTNYPEILNAIHRAKVPQYNTGKSMPTQQDTIAKEFSIADIDRFELQIQLLGVYIDKLVDNGIDVRLAMTEFEKKQNKYLARKDSAKR